MEKKEVRQSDLIVNPDQKDIKDAVKNTETRLKVPSGYYPIYLSTKGKLDAPKLLHFRNFSLEEVIELSTITQDDEKIFSLIKCMNKMVFEDFDCAFLNEEELTEIMMNIHFMFNSTSVGPYSYYVDEDIEDLDKKNHKDNKSKISFTSKELNTISIMDKFKEPIKITHDKKVFKFRLPRIKDTIYAYEYVLEKYKKERETFMELELDLQHNSNKIHQDHRHIDEKELKAYNEYQKNRAKDFMMVIEASLVIGNSSKKFELVEAIEKLNNNEIPLGFWLKYNKIVKDIKFGLDENVTFVCSKTKEIISRRFLFQSFDFVPDMELQGSDGYEVQFGD